MARPAGLEPAASRLEVSRSIQMSYGRLPLIRVGVPITTLREVAKLVMSCGMTMQAINANSASGRQFRYYDLVMAAFVAILLLSNVIGASKLAAIEIGAREFVFGAGILFFPLGYVIGDVLTEVYGFARARRVIWTGFAGLIFMAFMSWLVVTLPPADSWDGQAAYEQVFGQVWRIVGASIAAFWAGEFVNSFVMAKMKLWTRGKHLWSRTIGSTFVGQGVDSLIFYPLAFLGVWETSAVIAVMFTNWGLKVLWEVVLTPVTYGVVGWLKRQEGVDVFDQDTDFSPFHVKV